jgi:hypothetical protein
MQDTVRPYDADNCIAELKTNEAPNPEWWEPLNMTVANDDYEVVRWPSLHWAGWFDIFLVGQLIAFDGYKNHAAPGNDNDVKIFIDPLGHCQAAADEFPRHTIAGRSALPLLMSFELYKSTQTGKPFGNATDDFMKYVLAKRTIKAIKAAAEAGGGRGCRGSSAGEAGERGGQRGHARSDLPKLTMLLRSQVSGRHQGRDVLRPRRQRGYSRWQLLDDARQVRSALAAASINR